MREYWMDEDGMAGIAWMTAVALLAIIGLAIWSLWNSSPPDWIVAG